MYISACPQLYGCQSKAVKSLCIRQYEQLSEMCNFVCESWLTLYVDYSVQSDLSGFWGALQVAGVF